MSARPISFTHHERSACRRGALASLACSVALLPHASCFLSCSRSSFSLRRACSAAPSCSTLVVSSYAVTRARSAVASSMPEPCPCQTNDWSMSWMCHGCNTAHGIMRVQLVKKGNLADCLPMCFLVCLSCISSSRSTRRYKSCCSSHVLCVRLPTPAALASPSKVSMLCSLQ